MKPFMLLCVHWTKVYHEQYPYSAFFILLPQTATEDCRNDRTGTPHQGYVSWTNTEGRKLPGVGRKLPGVG